VAPAAQQIQFVSRRQRSRLRLRACFDFYSLSQDRGTADFTVMGALAFVALSLPILFILCFQFCNNCFQFCNNFFQVRGMSPV